jgi:indolepyruvate ferredoxin oxidoreductase, beta subunit
METTRLIIVAVGGQGNLLASKVLGEAALISNVPVRMSEIHGMAQRGGVVESAIVFGEAESSIISDSEADILLGFEPAETLRSTGPTKIPLSSPTQRHYPPLPCPSAKGSTPPSKP